MAKNRRRAVIPLAAQRARLQGTYPELIEGIKIVNSQLVFRMRLQPSRESAWHRVKIAYRVGYSPRVWLLEPKELVRVNGELPHHVYDYEYDGRARLCVYYPSGGEWHSGRYLADALVPWVITWLSAYEYWQVSGQWVYPEIRDAPKPRRKIGPRCRSRLSSSARAAKH